MEDSSTPVLGNAKLAQVAIVVADIEAASAQWALILGVPEAKIVETAPGSTVEMTYRGAPSDDRARVAFYDVGGVQLELIQPIGSESAWHEGHPEKGDRLHHIAFWTEDMGQAHKSLTENGVALMHRGNMGEGQYAYFDGQEKLGAVIELLERKRTPLTL